MARNASASLRKSYRRVFQPKSLLPIVFQARCGRLPLCCRAGVFLLWYTERGHPAWRGKYGSSYSFAGGYCPACPEAVGGCTSPYPGKSSVGLVSVGRTQRGTDTALAGI